MSQTLPYLRHSVRCAANSPINCNGRGSLLKSASSRRLSRRFYASVSAGELRFGQPLHETHPHILKAGELTPGITALEYAHRRSTLASKLPKHAIAVVAASDIKYRSGSVFYEYHQDPDFFYLTGFNEPGAIAIIGNDGSENDHIFHLYVREKDPKMEIWEGPRSGVQAAIDVFNADISGSIDNISSSPPSILSDASRIYTDLKLLDPSRPSLSGFFSSLQAKNVSSHKLWALRPVLNELRIFKSEGEIRNMRKVGQASGRAFTEAMRRQFAKEKDIHAFLEYQFKANGCDGLAFIPVIAGGQNALSIHYVRNDDVLRKGNMVLVDGGGEYGGYIADITRTWPVNGKFSEPQKDLYNAILSVQRTCISLCRESAGLSLDMLHRIAEKGLREQLKALGFDVSGDAMATLFPHHLGHYIGLDVHDCVGYPRTYELAERQCITIEPGIYVPDDERWPKQFRGIGIRIEDSVCVGEDNPLILTTEAVKEVDDIEALQ
ncbi:xaa-pro dipeptidase [Histoplasma capsulatum G186AR]|uniref:Xaa-Pro aminopeptidase n=1 Tax=Ajellomyces capsulatus TaxID=5037 RepID=A0A8H8D434_AJECA|nr:xaa-pro dipeptidase [Histoplasma capsulatum]QSS67249.1 xaa-pro dipeptidase [Histoplasma capsulatum G186AR]